jgi:hypothetical protein
MKLLEITKSDNPSKKLKAVFETDSKRTKTLHFGQKGADDFTLTGNLEQRARYLDRHRDKEDWSVPDTKGSLSARILWGKYTSREKNIAAFKKHFNL